MHWMYQGAVVSCTCMVHVRPSVQSRGTAGLDLPPRACVL